MKPSPELHELLGFFEVEPTLSDRDVPWFYDRFTYETMRGEDRILCEIEPAYGQLVLVWTRSDVLIARLELDDIASLHLATGHGVEKLIAKFANAAILDF